MYNIVGGIKALVIVDVCEERLFCSDISTPSPSEKYFSSGIWNAKMEKKQIWRTNIARQL